MSLNHRIRLLIKSKKISQAELSRVLDVTRGTVNQWLSGRIVPGHKQLMRIFEIYPEISADWLLLGKGQMEYGLNTSESEIAELKSKLNEKSEFIKLYMKLIEEKDARIELLIDQNKKLLPKD